MLRVLVISNMYPREHAPIVGIFVHEQVKALRRQGLDVRVVSGGPHWLPSRQPLAALRQIRWVQKHNTRPVWSDYDGVPVAYFPYFAGAFCRASFYPPLYRWSLMRWIDQIRADFPFDLVHAHTAFLDGTAGAAVAKRFNIPMVLTEHTGPFSLLTRKLLMRLQTQRALNAADRVLAVSSFLRSEILNQVEIRAPERVSVLPNGVDTDFFKPLQTTDEALNLDPSWPETYASTTEIHGALRRIRELVFSEAAADHCLRDVQTTLLRLSHSEEAPKNDSAPINVLWIGHFVEVKRVDRLVHAFAIAHRRMPRLRLTLLGGGTETLAAVKDQVQREDLADVVGFLPAQGRIDVLRELRRCSFLVLSSEVETFGVVSIEALATGKPVLATRCGGPEDVVSSSDVGMLTDNDPESLAIGLMEMARRIDSFEPNKIREYTLRNFSFSEVSKRLISLYKELLKT